MWIMLGKGVVVAVLFSLYAEILQFVEAESLSLGV